MKIVQTDYHRYQSGVHEGIEWSIGSDCDLGDQDYVKVYISRDNWHIFRGDYKMPLVIRRGEPRHLELNLKRGSGKVDFDYEVTCFKSGEEFEAGCDDCGDAARGPRIIVRNVIGVFDIRLKDVQALVRLAAEIESGDVPAKETLEDDEEAYGLVWEIWRLDSGDLVSREYVSREYSENYEVSVLLSNGDYEIKLLMDQYVVLEKKISVGGEVGLLGME